VPIEQVQILLGHQSVRITEKHYAPWVKERQEQLERDVRTTWGADPTQAWDVTTEKGVVQ
jgi:integrase/recombinase XerD